MPEPRDDRSGDGLDDALRPYVEAFRAIEQPPAEARSRTWASVSERTRPRPAVWPWAVVAGAVAIAAAVTLWLQPTSPTPSATAPPGHEQAPYEHHAETETGVAEPSGPRPRTEPTPGELEPLPSLELEPTAERDEPSDRSQPSPPRAKKRSKVPAPQPPTDDGGGLAEETRLFGEIQRAIVDGDTASALRAIARHEREFPDGAFRLERTVAKARALCAAGRATEARKLRDTFLQRHGGSHLAPRMQEVCAD